MIFKLGLLITFLTITICVATAEDKKDEPFSVENVWKKTACSSTCPPNWIKPVQKYYDDVIKAFSTFPGEVMEPADLVKTTFQTLLTKVIEFSNSDSKILSSGATGILESYAQVKLNIHSASGIIDEFYRVLPMLMKSYRQVVTNLTCPVGPELVCAVNTAITNLEREFICYVDEFRKGDGRGRKVEIDYEPVMKRVQTLVDTIALKGDVQLTECQLEDPRVKNALVVLSLVLDYVMVLVHGLSSSSEAIILEQKCEEPVVLHVIVVSVGVFVQEITESIVVNTVSNAVNVRAHLRTLNNSSSKLSSTLTAVFKSVGQITQQLANSVQGITQGLLKPLRLIG
ncbi:uncharacterized protein LOC119076111 isoform X2 [Bradysia coprophila]|uniref:uncharacterized protein LOC119076111 isoform X2 n=1 Tax=Bradysia coprophila TaxID=38358 RepID=UPI00187D6F74|nr:uncharacterized protein LOC119076111 isoform X2 [Bradysia coprophila]